MNSSKAIFLFVGLIFILGFGFLSQSFLPLATAEAFNNVQINIQTSSIQADYFVVDAFNMSGHMEASEQTQFAGASFELPNGQYIFTVTANNESYSEYSPVPLLAPSSGQSSPSEPSLPIYVAPSVEYGYSIQQVSSSMTITITTQNVAQFPTNSLSVEVSYANGTAAADASVSASVIGSSYYWGYEPNIVTWSSTGVDGVATLLIPTAPVQIDAWSWVPSNGTTVPVPQPGVAGQNVNGTVIAIPIYIGLAGTTLVVPPQTTVSITLQPQQNNYWVTPTLGTATPTATSSGSTYAAGPGSVPYPVYDQQQGNPKLQNLQVPSSTPSPHPIPEFSVATIVLTLLMATSITMLLCNRKLKSKQELVNRKA